MRELKVAVLDDDPKILKEVRSEISKLLKEEDLDLAVKYFENSKQLSFNNDDLKFNVYILDIEINEKDEKNNTITGLDIAKKIREKDRNAYIVFLTSHPEFVFDGYEVRAYRYILKDNFKSKLRKTLMEICKDLEEETKSFFLIRKNSKLKKLYYSDIYYVKKEKNQKNVEFVTDESEDEEDKKEEDKGKNDENKHRITLQEVYDQLPEDRFIFVDRAVIVNIRKVDTYMDGILFMKNGKEISVSRSHKKEIMARLAEYWKKKI